MVAFDMIESLKKLREKGFFQDFLSSNYLEEISSNLQFESFRSLNSMTIFPSQQKNIYAYEPDLIKFDHIISSKEASQISEILGILLEIL